MEAVDCNFLNKYNNNTREYPVFYTRFTDSINFKIVLYYSRFHITFAKIFRSWSRFSEVCRCISEFGNEVRFEFPNFKMNFRTLKCMILACDN